MSNIIITPAMKHMNNHCCTALDSLLHRNDNIETYNSRNNMNQPDHESITDKFAYLKAVFVRL